MEARKKKFCHERSIRREILFSPSLPANVLKLLSFQFKDRNYVDSLADEVSLIQIRLNLYRGHSELDRIKLKHYNVEIAAFPKVSFFPIGPDQSQPLHMILLVQSGPERTQLKRSDCTPLL